MPKFDTEDILDMVLSIMKTGGALNAAILAVETDKTAKGKALSPTLAPVIDAAYFEQTWNAKILNVNPAIFYGIEDVQANDGGGGAVAKTYQVFIEVVLVDSGMQNDNHKRISRYARALEELFAAAFSPDVLAGSSVKIQSVRPMAFKLQLDSDEEIKVGGISLTITLF